MGTEPAPPRRDPLADAMRPSATAAELAAAMRDGLVMRRWLGAVDVVRGLRTRASIHDLPPVAGPGPLRRPMLLLRRIAHVLVRPWWAAQSEFNESILAALDEVNRELAAHREALAALDGANLPPGSSPPSTAGPPQATRAASSPRTTALSRQTLEQVFAHSRLPSPSPSRQVLVIGDGCETFARLLSAFGFRASCLAAPPGPSPRLGDEPVALPVPTGSVDHVIDLRGRACDSVAEVMRALRPGGTLIGSLPLEPARAGAPAPAGDAAAGVRARLAPLRCAEVFLAVEDRGSWRILADGTEGAGAPSDSSADAMALFVAERP